MTYGWYREVYNAHEPMNRILMLAEDEGDRYVAIGMIGTCRFRDGWATHKITQISDHFEWNNGENSGVAPSFDEAWLNLSVLITHPDHFEDSEIFQISELENSA